MSHSGNSGHHGDGGQNIFHYAVGDNYNPLGTHLENYKLEHLTEGLRISNGIRFAILFIAFFGWLYIVYWLRHHEPLLQQSVGRSAATTSPSANQDKSIVASIRHAFPFKTSSDFGKIYVPTVEPTTGSPNYQPEQPGESQNPASSSIQTNTGEAISAPITYGDQGFDQRFGQPANSR